jgi:MoaD family protein
MAVTVKIPAQLRPVVGNQATVNVENSGTVSEVLDSLYEQFPELQDRISENGELRRFVNVYVADEDIRFGDGLETAVADGSEVTILPAVAGGC